MPNDQMPRIILNQPLQPVPKAQPLPAAPAPSAGDQMQQRRAQVQAELEKLQQEESSLLNNMKDWLAKVQGSETKQQALERELFELDRTVTTQPSPEQIKADLQKQLQQAEIKLKQITTQQKIDEKKAFDNYAAGGLDRQGLLEEMDRVSQRYADTQTAAQKTVQELKNKLVGLDQPVNPLPPTPSPLGAGVNTSEPTQITPPPSGGGTQGGGLLQKLITLPEMQSGLGRQLLIDLPNQGTLPTIERSAEGNGIIVSSDGIAGFVADADLLRAGATADDIISLPVSQVSTTSVAPFGGASGNN